MRNYNKTLEALLGMAEPRKLNTENRNDCPRGLSKARYSEAWGAAGNRGEVPG